MLTTRLIHPELLRCLAMAGHRSKVLITDGNYPHSTKVNPAATCVYLNLAPGVVRTLQVLEAVAGVVPIESVALMESEDGVEPPIWQTYRELLPETPFLPRPLPEFYQAAQEPDVALLIATGEQAPYANLLLTIGVVWPANAVHDRAAIQSI